MAIKLNSDQSIVNNIKSKLKENDGYCPCALVRNQDTKCMCKEFRGNIANSEFHGSCHCGLYVKE